MAHTLGSPYRTWPSHQTDIPDVRWGKRLNCSLHTVATTTVYCDTVIYFLLIDIMLNRFTSALRTIQSVGLSSTRQHMTVCPPPVISGQTRVARGAFSWEKKTSVRMMTSEGQIQSELMESMKAKIQSALEAQEVHVTDIQGDGRHVEIVVVSSQFEGKNSVNRQRMVYKVCKDDDEEWKCTFCCQGYSHCVCLSGAGHLGRATRCCACSGCHGYQNARRSCYKVSIGTPIYIYVLYIHYSLIVCVPNPYFTSSVNNIYI